MEVDRMLLSLRALGRRSRAGCANLQISKPDTVPIYVVAFYLFSLLPFVLFSFLFVYDGAGGMYLVFWFVFLLIIPLPKSPLLPHRQATPHDRYEMILMI